MAAARALASLPPAPEITAPIWEKRFRTRTKRRCAMLWMLWPAFGRAGGAAIGRCVAPRKAPRADRVRLGRMGPDAAPATPALAALLADKNERVAHEAAIALAKIGPGAKDAVPSLVKVLGQADARTPPLVPMLSARSARPPLRPNPRCWNR